MISPGKRSFSGLPEPPYSTPALANALKAFSLERQIEGVTPATLAANWTQLKPFAAWCQSRAVDLAQLTVDDVRNYLAERQRFSQSALYEAARRLKTFFRWGAQENLYKSVP